PPHAGEGGTVAGVGPVRIVSLPPPAGEGVCLRRACRHVDARLRDPRLLTADRTRAGSLPRLRGRAGVGAPPRRMRLRVPPGVPCPPPTLPPPAGAGAFARLAGRPVTHMPRRAGAPRPPPPASTSPPGLP